MVSHGRSDFRLCSNVPKVEQNKFVPPVVLARNRNGGALDGDFRANTRRKPVLSAITPKTPRAVAREAFEFPWAFGPPIDMKMGLHCACSLMER